MKISLVIPVYNVSDFIVECLDSIALQKDVDAECIIVDDCGTDDSVSKASNWIDSYVGNIDFRIVHHSQNKGISEARNTGIREAKGDYVLFIDSDDYLLPHALENLSLVAKSHPEADVVIGNLVCPDEGLVKMWGVKDDFPETTSSRQVIEKSSVACPVVWNKLVRRSLLVEHNLFFNPNVSMAEDLLFTYQLSKIVKTIAYTRSETYYYRIRPGSITTGTERVVTRITDMLFVLSTIQTQEKDNRCNHVRFRILKELKFLLSGRRPYTLTGVWHKYDSFVFSFFLSELFHLRLRNSAILLLFLPPFSKMLARR